jgi:hypothetical protein
MSSKKLSAVLALVAAAGLCAAPTAQAGVCPPGDPVYDPGAEGPCNFAMAPAMPGAEATVIGRWIGRSPWIDPQYSYLEDTADDGLDANVWVRYTIGAETGEKWLAQASGPGATVSFRWPLAPEVDAFHTRVCLGPDTTNCSAWHG